MKQVKGDAVKEELIPGVSVELLKALHILTRDGDLNADSRRKLKQVKHLLQLLEPAVHDIVQRHGSPLVVDCGAGKGYLGFLLAQTHPVRVLNIESRADLVEKTRKIAADAGIEGMRFFAGAVADAKPDERVHMVLALHACDTATDDAIGFGLRAEADWIAVVPCCQAEVAQLLKGVKSPVAELHAHPIHRREFGAHLTNVIRSLVLEARGYQVTVTELVGWEHSLKNELIIAKRVQRENPMARKKLDALLGEVGGIAPKILSV